VLDWAGRLAGPNQKTKLPGMAYGAATPAVQIRNLVLIRTDQRSFIAKNRTAAIMVILEPRAGSSLPPVQQIQAAPRRYLQD